jgi:CheY-like chemotaxis protein
MGIKKEIQILLAEDNMINRQIATIIFKQMELTFDIASDGREAFEMHQKNRYDLIFMDIQMPVMSGLEATQLIRAYEKEAGLPLKVYIVALTASIVAEKKEECMLAGIDEFLEKPLMKNKLAKLMSQFGI